MSSRVVVLHFANLGRLTSIWNDVKAFHMNIHNNMLGLCAYLEHKCNELERAEKEPISGLRSPLRGLLELVVTDATKRLKDNTKEADAVQKLCDVLQWHIFKEAADRDNGASPLQGPGSEISVEIERDAYDTVERHQPRMLSQYRLSPPQR